MKKNSQRDNENKTTQIPKIKNFEYYDGDLFDSQKSLHDLREEISKNDTGSKEFDSKATIDMLKPYLYTTGNFVVSPTGNRQMVVCKLEPFYFEYCAYDKEAFTLNIYILNKERTTCSLFFERNVGRFPNVKFEEMVPFSLTTYYKNMCRDYNKVPLTDEKRAYKKLKEMMTRLIQGKNISLRERYDTLSFFYTEAEKWRLGNSTQKSQVQLLFYGPLIKNEVMKFHENIDLKPESVLDVAAKIVTIYFCQLSLDRSDISIIIKEYLETNKIENVEEFYELLISKLFDQERYCLKTVLQEDTLKEVSKGITQAVTEKKANKKEDVKKLDLKMPTRVSQELAITFSKVKNGSLSAYFEKWDEFFRWNARPLIQKLQSRVDSFVIAERKWQKLDLDIWLKDMISTIVELEDEIKKHESSFFNTLGFFAPKTFPGEEDLKNLKETCKNVANKLKIDDSKKFVM